MELSEYISKLEQFVNSEYSLSRDTLIDIYDWDVLGKSPEYRAELIAKGKSEHPNSKEFLELGLGGNYLIELNNSPIPYFDIVNDFNTKPISNHSWKKVSDYQDKYYKERFLSKGFICESLVMYMQIERVEGESRFMFPGIVESLFQEGTKFNYWRDLANSVINISEYLIQNKIPTTITLHSNYHYRNKLPIPIVTYSP